MEMEEKRLRELALRAAHACAPTYTRFLEPPMEIACRAAANFAGCEVAFEGGYEGAERRMAGFYAGGAEALSFPIRRLSVDWNARYGSIGHRDILGALMGLGIRRDAVGDICLHEKHCDIFILAELARYLLDNLTSAGRQHLSCERIALSQAEKPPQKLREVRVTVSSLRLDAVLAAAFHLSRGAAAEAVNAGRTAVNSLTSCKPDRLLAEGDEISLRGSGKFRILTLGGETKKGRLALTVGIFI